MMGIPPLKNSVFLVLVLTAIVIAGRREVDTSPPFPTPRIDYEIKWDKKFAVPDKPYCYRASILVSPAGWIIHYYKRSGISTDRDINFLLQKISLLDAESGELVQSRSFGSIGPIAKITLKNDTTAFVFSSQKVVINKKTLTTMLISELCLKTYKLTPHFEQKRLSNRNFCVNKNFAVFRIQPEIKHRFKSEYVAFVNLKDFSVDTIKIKPEEGYNDCSLQNLWLSHNGRYLAVETFEEQHQRFLLFFTTRQKSRRVTKLLDRETGRFKMIAEGKDSKIHFSPFSTAYFHKTAYYSKSSGQMKCDSARIVLDSQNSYTLPQDDSFWHLQWLSKDSLFYYDGLYPKVINLKDSITSYLYCPKASGIRENSIRQSQIVSINNREALFAIKSGNQIIRYDKVDSCITLFDSAVAYNKSGHYWEAAQLFGQLSRECDNFALEDELYYHWGETYHKMVFDSTAKEMWQKGIVQFPNSRIMPYYYSGLQHIARRKGETDKVFHYHRLLDSMVAPVEIISASHYLCGKIAFEQDSLPQAEAHFQSVINSTSSFEYAQLGLVDIMIRIKKLEEAELVLYEILKRNVLSKEDLTDLFSAVYLKLGYLSFEKKYYDDAIDNFERVHSGSSVHQEELLGLAWCQFRKKEFRKALMLVEQLEKRFPQSPYLVEGTYLKGSCYIGLKEYDASIKCFEKSFALYYEEMGGDNVHCGDFRLRESSRVLEKRIYSNSLKANGEKIRVERWLLRKEFADYKKAVTTYQKRNRDCIARLRTDSERKGFAQLSNQRLFHQ